MCYFSLSLPGVTPRAEHLLNAAAANDDGHGWAIVAGTRILTGRSMDAELAIDDFLAARSRYQDGPATWHSRWATHGDITTANTHPFQVGQDSRTMLVHNGILRGKCLPKTGDPRSDTGKLAGSILPKLLKGKSLDHLNITNAITDLLVGGSKVAILTANPVYRKSWYLYGESLGAWEDGTWHSNSGHKRAPYVSTKSAWGFDGWDWTPASDDRPDGADLTYACPMCDSFGHVDPVSNVCWECLSCLDCFAPETDCLCFAPPVSIVSTWRNAGFDNAALIASKAVERYVHG